MKKKFIRDHCEWESDRWEDCVLGGVSRICEWFGTKNRGWLNEPLATLDPWTCDPLGAQIPDGGRVEEEDCQETTWLLTTLLDWGSVFWPKREDRLKIQLMNNESLAYT